MKPIKVHGEMPANVVLLRQPPVTEKTNNIVMVVITIIVVLMTTSANFLGFAFLGYELSNGMTLVALFIGAVGVLVNIGKVVSYFNESNFLLKVTLHFLALVFTALFIAHLMDFSVNQTNQEKDEYAIAQQQYNDILHSKSLFDTTSDSIAELNKKLIGLKNKKVKKDTVWVDSNSCTNDKHPNDCTEIARIIIDITALEQKIEEISLSELSNRKHEILEKYPEITLKKSFSDKESIIVRLKAMIAPSANISVWILMFSLSVSFIIELVESIVLSMQFSNKSIKHDEKQDKKFAKSLMGKIENYTNCLIHMREKVAVERAKAEGERKAQLDYDHEEKKRQLENIVDNSTVDIANYLKVITDQKIIEIIGSKQILSTESSARIKELKFIKLMLGLYKDGGHIKIDETIAELYSKYSDDSSFINPPFFSRKIKILVEIGFVKNTSTGKNGKYYWEDKANITLALSNMSY